VFISFDLLAKKMRKNPNVKFATINVAKNDIGFDVPKMPSFACFLKDHKEQEPEMMTEGWTLKKMQHFVRTSMLKAEE
jgi:hypothetical protein